MAKKQLHPGSRWLFRIKGFFGSLFTVFFLSFFFSVLLAGLKNGEPNFSWISPILAFGVLLLIIIAEIYARLAYKFWFYEFADSQLRIERGIIWKRYSNIPYERIQNVDITRGIIARLNGFSTVNIQTAGYSMPAGNRGGIGSEGYIPAVPMAEAEHIREFVIKKISRKGRKQGL
jgi:membrane protein YdbS with pleckstrin-like domain